MNVFKKIVNNFERIILSTIMVTMVVLIFVQVFTRYVLGDALTWSEETSRYLFIWLIFLSIGISFIDKKHISIDILKDRLSAGKQKILTQFIYVLLFILSIFFVYQGYLLIDKMSMLGQKSSTLEIPMWIVYLSLPVGFLFMTIRIIQSSVYLWNGKGEEVNDE